MLQVPVTGALPQAAGGNLRALLTALDPDVARCVALRVGDDVFCRLHNRLT